MYAADYKLRQRLEPHLRRVLVVDPSPVTAPMIAGLMRGLGASQLLMEANALRAQQLASQVDFNVVFVERSGPELDGEGFTRWLRRSDLPCRKAPVIMVSADATANIITGSRDAGVHEFLLRPFTSESLIRRVEAVMLKPRDWIEAAHYVGPDRRRFNSGEYKGKRKRRSDVSRLDRSAHILKSAIHQFGTDPAQARRAITEQAAFLRAALDATASPRLAVAVAMLELSAGDATQATLTVLVKDVLDLFEAASPLKAA